MQYVSLMKTKLMKLMCTLFAAMVCMSVDAQNYCGSPNLEDVTWELNGSQLVFEGTGAIKEYSHDMPTAYPWYEHANDIQMVVIGEGITEIPAWAFAMYENLRSISLPSTLTKIGWSCLEETNLWNVSLPEGLKTIESYAFMMCPFPSVSIPSTVTEIGERAFGYCEDLTTVGCYADVPPTLGSNVFGDCPAIETVYVQTAKIADYKDTAGWSDFGDKIQSPAGYCGPDGSDEDGDDDVTKATWAFDMSTHTLTISGTKLGQYNRPWDSAGMGGSGGGFNPDNNVGYPFGIYHLVIGEGITAIPAMEFYMNLAITDVTLPSTLTSIGMGAFGENFALESFTINATTPPTLGEDVFMDMTTIPTIYVPVASVGTYKAAAGWSDYADKIVAQGGAPATTTTFTYLATEKVTAFDEYANFTGATALASHDFADGAGTVVYNGTVTALESGAFYYNNTKEALTSITLPESLMALGDDAFRSCTGLTAVTFDGTPALTTINKRAFQGCSSLATIAIPASVETIGNGAFSGCSGLASVTFPGTSALTTIGTTAFSNCKSLATITLPESVTTIGEVQIHGENTYYNGSVFSGAGLTSFVVPKNLTTIYGGGHFRNCPITSLAVDADNAKYEDRGSNAIIEKGTDKLVIGCVATTVPDGIKTIGYEAFFAEEQPFALTLPESVTAIEARAFHYATGLTAINIPSKVTEIPDETFAQCNLTELVIPDGVTSIGGMAFMMCMSLKTITIGSGLTTIDNWAFECPNVTDIYCYAAPFTTWSGSGFADAKDTKFHVADVEAWSTAFPDANVTFVGDLKTLALSEETDNTAALVARNGHVANVTLTRTLKTGSYNTFAVPFAIDAATLTAKGITAKKLTASALGGNTLTLTFADATTIEAGKPYLVKVAADMVNPTFNDITIVSTAIPTETTYADLVPTTGKTLIVGAAGSENNTQSVLILGAENKLSYPTVVNTPDNDASYLKGFRSYFQLKGDAALARNITLDFGEGISGITTTDCTNEDGAIYTLDGRRISLPVHKGVYVVNGKKIVIK